MSTPVLEAVQAEREQLEERCAWHLAQLDRLEQQLEALKEIERLAGRLGHGTAGEAPPATVSAAPAPSGGVSPARSVPKKRPAARQRPAQRTAAGPVPKVCRKAPDGEGRAAVLRAVQAGARTQAEIIDRTGLTQNQARHAVRVLVAAGDLAAEGATKARRYRPARPPEAPAPEAPSGAAEPDRATQPPASDEIARRDRALVMGVLRSWDGSGVSHGRLAGLTGLGRGRLTTVLIALREAGLAHQDPRTRRWHAYEESAAA